eukprot:15233-Heterococcus_DN1.PRE.1
METFKLVPVRPGGAEAASRVRAADAEASLTESLAKDIQTLWADEGVKACYERRDEFWLLDARVLSVDYMVVYTSVSRQQLQGVRNKVYV